jgi:formylglycine-generating enzyme required for sulfatase activity
MKTKNLIALSLLLPLTVLTACSNDEDQQLADGRVPITLSAAEMQLNAFTTRSAADTALNKNYIETGQTVRVRVSNTGQNSWTDYNFSTGEGGTMTVSGTAPYYPMDNTHVDIVAYYPSFAGTSFTVRTDQSTNDGYMASDLLFASKSNQEKTNGTVPLQFEHKMAKVVVTATAGAGITAIEGITLHKVLPEVPFNQQTGVVSSATGSETNVIIAKEESAATVSGACLIPAQTIEGDLLTIETNLGTATYRVNSKTFAAGKVYCLRIGVNRAAVGATTEVNNWTDTEGVVIKNNDEFRTFIIRNNKGTYSLTMVFVEGGPYTTLAGKTVTGTLSDFYIAQTETTNGAWWMLTNFTVPSGQTRAGAEDPVAMVTWDDAVNFISRLNSHFAGQLDGMTFKLPSDAQWEYAARGGTAQERYTYAGGDDKSLVMVDADMSPTSTFGVAHLLGNSLGIYDMSGNVWEWVQDWDFTVTNGMNLGKDYVCTTKKNASTEHLIRGASWCEGSTSNTYLQPLGASRYPWTSAEANVGFRVVLQ